jgi:hypothetical protein
MRYVNRHPRGQQRDKPYREALRLELAAAGEDMKKLREIARVHIKKAANGDMQAIKEMADRLDGKPAQMLEHSIPDESQRLVKIVHEFVHHEPHPRQELQQQEPILIEGETVSVRPSGLVDRREI